MLPPQLLGLNLAPGILRCEHSQLVEGVVWRLEWEGPGSAGSLSHMTVPSPSPNQEPGSLGFPPPSLRGREQAWLGLYPLSPS